MGNQSSSDFVLHSSEEPEAFNFRNQKPDIFLTQEEIVRLEAIFRANIEYRRQYYL